MIVLRISRDSERLGCGHAAEDEGHLGLGERRGSGHVSDVADGRVAAEGDIKERGADAAREKTALDGATAVVRDVEYALVDERLRCQARGRKNELLVRILIAVDARVDGWASTIECVVGMIPHKQGADHVRAFMRENAGSEPKSEPFPLMAFRILEVCERFLPVERRENSELCGG